MQRYAIALCIFLLISLSFGSHIRRFAQDQSRPNQYLVFDDDDTSILVNTGEGTENGNYDLLSFIASQGVDHLDTIFITDATEEEFGGVPYFVAEFPDARVEVATKAIKTALVNAAAVAFPTVNFDWNANVKVHEDDETFDELDLVLIADIETAESENYSMLYNYDDNYVITGDALYIDHHPYLGVGVNIVTLRNWYRVVLPALNEGGSLGSNRNTLYYPGHGPPGDYIQVETAIEYLSEFDDLVISCPNTEFPILLTTVRDTLIADYPDFEGRQILQKMVDNPAWLAAQTSANPCAIFQYLSSDNSAGMISFSVTILLLALIALL